MTFSDDGDEDEVEQFSLADMPGLAAVSRFAQMLSGVPWLAQLGETLDERDIYISEDYLVALGFPDAEPVAVLNWQDAADAASNLDWNSAWWEAEEQQRMALTVEACNLVDEESLTVALTHVSQRAGEAAQEASNDAAERFNIQDEALLQAVAGAITQSCYQAALVLAAEVEDGEHHPFALKYRLFECGRWPVALVGRSFHVF